MIAEVEQPYQSWTVNELRLFERKTDSLNWELVRK